MFKATQKENSNHRYRYESDPEWIEEREDKPRSECSCCQAPIFTDAEGYTSKGAARIQRGRFAIPDEAGEFTVPPMENEDIKFEIYVCESCMMDDPDLCRFFNGIGKRVR